MPAKDAAYDRKRLRFGSYELDDPRPIALAAPYTFFLPSASQVDRLRPDDFVQLIFRSIPPGRIYDAERMWVRVASLTPDMLIGVLESTPGDIPQLEKGASVQFARHHIVNVLPHSNDDVELSPHCREYWERCLVDDCVLNEGVAVGYLYREAPDPELGDERHLDSGWRIRGDYRGLTDEAINARALSHVALGAVLNRDDSWLHLVDMPVGSAFLRDFEAGGYAPE